MLYFLHVLAEIASIIDYYGEEAMYIVSSMPEGMRWAGNGYWTKGDVDHCWACDGFHQAWIPGPDGSDVYGKFDSEGNFIQ